MEAVFRPKFFLIFSNAFRAVPARKHRKLTGIHRKNPKNFRPEYGFHILAISVAFLQDTLAFPHLSCRILRDPVAGIIDLGAELEPDSQLFLLTYCPTIRLPEQVEFYEECHDYSLYTRANLNSAMQIPITELYQSENV